MCTDPLPPTAEDDWNVVSVECGSLAAKWEQLSACLGLAKADIDRIRESRPRDIAGCWSEALNQWIKQNYSTQGDQGKSMHYNVLKIKNGIF